MKLRHDRNGEQNETGDFKKESNSVSHMFSNIYFLRMFIVNVRDYLSSTWVNMVAHFNDYEEMVTVINYPSESI
jgi:hypothetical protein